MKKPILVALIAATALAPFTATAQEWRGRGNRGGEARSAPQPSAQPAQRPSFSRPDGNAGWQRQRSESAPQARPQREGGNFDRSQWQARRAERQPQATPAPAPQQAVPVTRAPGTNGADVQRGRRDWNGGAQMRAPQTRPDNRTMDNRTVTPQQYFGNRVANGQDARRDWNRDRNDGQRRDWNRNNDNQRRDWNRNDNQRRDWNRGNDWNRNGRWDRGWRSDQRYDWQGWRNQNRGAFRLPRYYPPRGYNYGYQRFSIGVTLGSILFAQNYWISDPWEYRLPPVDYPYRWVRYYNDALLVDTYTGEVVDVIYDIFW